MKFYNKTKGILQVKDAGGAVSVGPFLPGTKELGPWYDASEISDSLFEMWLDHEKIEAVE
jgi:hypothetical protein